MRESKNILILRSANLKVMDELIKYLSNKYDLENHTVYFLVQENSLEYFKEKYSKFNFLVKDNTKFNFYKMNNSKLMKTIKQTEYDEVYISSSYYHFNECYQLFLIASKLKSKRVLLFNCKGVVYEKKVKTMSLIFKHIASNILFYMRATYEFLKLLVLFIFKSLCFRIRKILSK